MGLGRVLFTVHDSLVFEVPEDRQQEAMDVIVREMTTPPYETHIKLYVDVEAGRSLGEVETIGKSLTAA
jgi:DNA polymerase I-like protein with 3'-5' exonuclease and polymerase domains